MATICGMAVIFTVSASTPPPTAPMARPMMIHSQLKPAAEQRADDGHQHADRADQVAPPRRARGRQRLEREDEQDGCDQVGKPTSCGESVNRTATRPLPCPPGP